MDRDYSTFWRNVSKCNGHKIAWIAIMVRFGETGQSVMGTKSHGSSLWYILAKMTAKKDAAPKDAVLKDDAPKDDAPKDDVSCDSVSFY